MSHIIPWVVVIPLLGAALVFLAGRRASTPIGLLTSLVTLVATANLTWLIWNDGPQRYTIGGWDAPLGINLYADGLSTLMILMTASVGIVISIYARGYFSHENERRAFWPLWLFLWAALNTLYLSADVFNLYVGLELLTMAAVGLVILAGDRIALTAGLRYLLAAVLGSLAYLFGVGLLYAGFDTLDMVLLGERMDPTLAAGAAAALMTIGLMLKTALFPLHFWLPQAHANAPAPVSAALSALVVKASFYLLLRLWFEVFPGAVSVPAGQFLGVLGSIAILWGSFQAIRARRLKLLIAHSTVAQIGYLFLVIPLAAPHVGAEPGAAPWSFDAWSGGVYHALSHSFAKASMFMAAGTIMAALGHDRMRDLTGVGNRLPITIMAMGLSGLSLIGLPPSGGFVGKWRMLNAAIESGQWWWVAVLLLGGLLTAGYIFLIAGQALAIGEHGEDDPANYAPVPRVLEVTTLLLALVALLLGLRAAEPLALIEIGNPFAPQIEAGD